MNDRGFIGLCLFLLGLVEQCIDNPTQADAYFGEALALGRGSGHPRLISMTSVHSIPTLLALGQPAQAKERLQEGLALARATQDRWLVFAALGYLGRVLGTQGDWAGSRAALQEALAVAQEVGNLHDLAWAEVGLADVTLAAGEMGQADVHYRAGLQLALDASALPIAIEAMAGLAVLRAQAGDRERALELAAQVAHHPAGSDKARSRASAARRLLDADSESLAAASGARDFEEIVQGILTAG